MYFDSTVYTNHRPNRTDTSLPLAAQHRFISDTARTAALEDVWHQM